MDVIPRRMFTVAQRIGGQVMGAFTADDTLAGFAMAIPGIRDGEPYLHSHMLAVQPKFRNAGVGRRLKLAQREDALKRGIRLMEWTFDPLEIKNSFFNIEKLGAITRSYTPIFMVYPRLGFRVAARPTGCTRNGGWTRSASPRRSREGVRRAARLRCASSCRTR